jgi:hypothetical protein
MVQFLKGSSALEDVEEKNLNNQVNDKCEEDVANDSGPVIAGATQIPKPGGVLGSVST